MQAFHPEQWRWTSFIITEIIRIFSKYRIGSYNSECSQIKASRKLSAHKCQHASTYIKLLCALRQEERKNIPRTAHGKLKAVITPTIPSGFHTCDSKTCNTVHEYTSCYKMALKLVNNYSLKIAPQTSCDLDLQRNKYKKTITQNRKTSERNYYPKQMYISNKKSWYGLWRKDRWLI